MNILLIVIFFLIISHILYAKKNPKKTYILLVFIILVTIPLLYAIYLSETRSYYYRKPNKCFINENLNKLGRSRCFFNSDCRGRRTCSSLGYCKGESGC